MPGTGTFLNSTCIITNQSSEGIRYIAVLTEIIRRQRRNTTTRKAAIITTCILSSTLNQTKTKVKQCRRDFRKDKLGNYIEIRKSLALIDGNDKLKNKTASECWNILRGG